MKNFVTALIALTTLYSYSQPLENQFFIGTANNLSSYIGTIKVNNNILLYANSSSSSSLNKSEDSYGLSDGWLVMMDENGSVIWDLTLGGASNDYLTKVYYDGTDLYAVLNSESGISGNKTVENYGGRDFWVIKLNVLGDILWQKNYGGSANDNPTDILFRDNKVYVLGSSSSGISGNKTVDSFGGSDSWLIELDILGDVLNQKSYGGEQGEFEPKMLWNSFTNSYYLTSESTSGISGNKTTVNYGGPDIWLLEIDENLDIVNQITLGGDNVESLEGDVVTNGPETFILCSSLSGSSGVKTEESFGGFDYWLVKLNSNFEIVYETTHGGDFNDRPFSCLIDEDKLIAIGTSESGNTGSVTEISNGLSDNYFIAFNLWSGDVEYQRQFGANLNEFPVSIIKSSSYNYTIFSTSESSANGDKTIPLSANGAIDLWVGSFASTLGFFNEEIGANSIRIYPNPSKCNDNFFVENIKDLDEISISDMKGSIVSYKRNGNYFTINKAGTYLMTIMNEHKGVKKIKVFIQ